MGVHPLCGARPKCWPRATSTIQERLSSGAPILRPGVQERRRTLPRGILRWLSGLWLPTGLKLWKWPELWRRPYLAYAGNLSAMPQYANSPYAAITAMAWRLAFSGAGFEVIKAASAPSVPTASPVAKWHSVAAAAASNPWLPPTFGCCPPSMGCCTTVAAARDGFLLRWLLWSDGSSAILRLLPPKKAPVLPVQGLVKVAAASNDYDWYKLRTTWWLFSRLKGWFRKKKDPVATRPHVLRSNCNSAARRFEGRRRPLARDLNSGEWRVVRWKESEA